MLNHVLTPYRHVFPQSDSRNPKLRSSRQCLTSSSSPPYEVGQRISFSSRSCGSRIEKRKACPRAHDSFFAVSALLRPSIPSRNSCARLGADKIENEKTTTSPMCYCRVSAYLLFQNWHQRGWYTLEEIHAGSFRLRNDFETEVTRALSKISLKP